MSDAKLVNIARLMTTYNFEIEQLPNNLKCAQCKLVLKDACQVPCGCTYCRACLDEMMAKGDEFCQGISEDCVQSPLSRFVSHYGANKRVCKLPVKCPFDGCVQECQLINIEEHLRQCHRKVEDCPFRELGCTQDKLDAEMIDKHLHHEICRHSEILISMIVNINREIDKLKQINEVSSKEIEMLKHEIVRKDAQIRSIMDKMKHVLCENESIKNDIKSIKDEKEDLAGRVRILSEEIERETDERRVNDELDSARVIDHVDREIAAVTQLIDSNIKILATEIQLLRDNIGSINQDVQSINPDVQSINQDVQSINQDVQSINQDVQSIKEDISSVKPQMQSLKMLVGLDQVDANFEWLIDIDVDKILWKLEDRLSKYFFGEVHRYKYRLVSGNYGTGTTLATLYIYLVIDAGPNDGQLAWPFEARVIVTVTDKDRGEACKSISLQCQIERPPDNDCRYSGVFKFLHSELRGAGLNLSRGIRVSCLIVPGTGSDSSIVVRR